MHINIYNGRSNNNNHGNEKIDEIGKDIEGNKTDCDFLFDCVLKLMKFIEFASRKIGKCERCILLSKLRLHK